MDKKTVASILDEIAVLLDLQGENPFKVRAYQNAARVIANLEEDLEAVVKENRLAELKGIGPHISERIAALVTYGRLPYYEELKKSCPAGLQEMMRIQNLGPKRARHLWETLGLRDIASLEKACRDGRVAALEGFGEKTQARILEGIAFLEKHAEESRFDIALTVGERWLEAVKQLPSVQRASLCGSLRRRKELIRDLDLLVSAGRPSAVMDAFVKLPGIERVLSKGDTRTSVVVTQGLQVDLRVVEDAQFPFALHYFTGSKEHNIAMRRLANEKGLRLNEYGLFHADLRPVACKTEEALFSRLGMDYIPPELREDRGEIEDALAHILPRLIDEDDLRGAFHVHTTWSDGQASLEEMVAAAQKLGWDYIGLSDHSQSVTYARGLSEVSLKKQKAEIEALRKKFKIHIFWGTECDILKDGTLDYPDRVLAGFDFVVASVHSHFKMTESDMTRRIIRALANTHVTFLGHPTGRLLLEREGYAVNIPEVLAAAADTGASIEINAHPQRLDLDWRHMAAAKAKGIGMGINPDAHAISGLTDVRYGVGVARKGGLTVRDIVNAWPLEKVKAFLARRRNG